MEKEKEQDFGKRIGEMGRELSRGIDSLIKNMGKKINPLLIKAREGLLDIFGEEAPQDVLAEKVQEAIIYSQEGNFDTLQMDFLKDCLQAGISKMESIGEDIEDKEYDEMDFCISFPSGVRQSKEDEIFFKKVFGAIDSLCSEHIREIATFRGVLKEKDWNGMNEEEKAEFQGRVKKKAEVLEGKRQGIIRFLEKMKKQIDESTFVFLDEEVKEN